MKFFSICWIGLVLGFSSAASPALFSEEEQSIILAFPTQNGSLQWDELQSRVDEANQDLLSFPEAYIGAIVSLRTGNADKASSLLSEMADLASEPRSIALFEHLKAFLAFYKSEPVDRKGRSKELLDRIYEYSNNSMNADWLVGTSLTLLIDSARSNSDPVLLADTLRAAERVISEPREFDTTAWLLSAYIKGAYTATLQADGDTDITASYFLIPALGIINDVNVMKLSEDERLTVESAYFRIHAIGAAEDSRLTTRGIEIGTRPLPFIRRYHSNFQNECVVKIRTVSKRITSTSYVGTGGFVFRLSVNSKGRVSFQELIDGQPNRLKKMDMERTYKDIAKRLRVDLDNKKSQCREGGELILPYSLSAG